MTNKEELKNCNEFHDMRNTFYCNVILITVLSFGSTAAGILYLCFYSLKNMLCVFGYLIALLFIFFIGVISLKVWIKGPLKWIITYLKEHPEVNVSEIIQDKKFATKYSKRLYEGSKFLFFIEDFGEINLVAKDDIKKMDVIGATATKNNKPHLVIQDYKEHEYQIYFFSRKKAEEIMQLLSSNKRAGI